MVALIYERIPIEAYVICRSHPSGVSTMVKRIRTTGLQNMRNLNIKRESRNGSKIINSFSKRKKRSVYRKHLIFNIF